MSHECELNLTSTSIVCKGSGSESGRKTGNFAKGGDEKRRCGNAMDREIMFRNEDEAQVSEAERGRSKTCRNEYESCEVGEEVEEIGQD